MPKGRPRLTPEEYEGRLRAYCAAYSVKPTAQGLPPFPSGQRETPQHREWMKLYKAHDRMARRDGASADQRRALLDAQAGRCPICGEPVDLSASVEHGPGPGEARALMHPRCNQLVGMAESLGPQALERVRQYLWTTVAKRPDRRR